MSKFRNFPYIPIPVPVRASRRAGLRLHVRHRRGLKRRIHKLNRKMPRIAHRKREEGLDRLMDVAGVLFKHSPIDYFFEK